MSALLHHGGAPNLFIGQTTKFNQNHRLKNPSPWHRKRRKYTFVIYLLGLLVGETDKAPPCRAALCPLVSNLTSISPANSADRLTHGDNPDNQQLTHVIRSRELSIMRISARDYHRIKLVLHRKLPSPNVSSQKRQLSGH
jgi:hypothetical protein